MGDTRRIYPVGAVGPVVIQRTGNRMLQASSTAHSTLASVADVGNIVHSKSHYYLQSNGLYLKQGPSSGPVHTVVVTVEFYLYPTVGTVLIHSIKPELTE